MGKKYLIFLLLASMLVWPLALTAGAQTTSGYEVGYSKVDLNPYWNAWVNYTWGSDSGVPETIKNKIPTFTNGFVYDEYDLLPLPMAGYGGNETRLSRPKLMDDNGSGVGASTQNVTRAKTSASATSKTTLKPGSFYSYVYANNPDYQDVHLSSNRYTRAFAQEMGVTYADGVYGENDGDGVWGSCVLVKDPQTDSYLLMISVDIISLGDSIVDLIKKSILQKPEIQAIGLTEGRILINANHTHGSVDLGAKYGSSDTATTYSMARDTFGDGVTFTGQQMYYHLNFYKNYIRRQLAAAAVQAVEDLEPALTMEKGSIDAGQQIGKHMNGVRHNVQTYDGVSVGKSPITYVRGSSFNNYMRSTSSYDSHMAGSGFTASQPVSESNDRLNILQFTFQNKAPIAMVNYRAHSTANNKESAKALHYNISSDWVSPLRYEMEQAGYRFSLLYGNSGNLSTGVSSASDKVILYDQAYYSSADGHWILPATSYGRAIAQAALALLKTDTSKNAILDQMHAVPMGQLLLQTTQYLSQRQIFTPLAYAAAMEFYLNGAPAAGGRYTVSDGQTVSYDGRTITLNDGEGGSFTIASKYHANSILSRYGVTKKVTLELNAIRLGSQVAMYSTPLEAADRYFTNTITKTTDIVANASKYNDWWNLNEDSAWGVPFDLSLTNGAGGYIANQLAYDYNKDYTGTEYIVATGSYESQNSNHNRGEGEKIVARLNSMLRNMEPRQAYCVHCKETVTFQPLSAGHIQAVDTADTTSDQMVAGGHYFLAGDFEWDDEVRILSSQQVCLDLNGFTYSCECYSACSRAFSVRGVLNVMDLSQENPTGKIQGLGVKTTIATNLAGGSLNVDGTLNLYSGTLTQHHKEGYGAARGGVVNVSGTLNVYGGSICGGTAQNGGNIYLQAGSSLTVTGGTIEGGTVTGNGGNIYAVSDTTLTVTGGLITGGRAQQDGASTMGGNIYTKGTFVMEGGTITGGHAHFGGNVQVQEKTACFTMRGGHIYGGSASYKTDVSDLCTGQSSKEAGYSMFRMEGGYIGIVYVQGVVVLTGTTAGETPVRVVVKAPGERLSFEGNYTGNIDLVLNDSNYQGLPAGSKIGNANNADLSGATIYLPDYPDMIPAVSGSDLVLRVRPVAAVGGKEYGTVSEAVTAYNTAGGWLVLKKADLELTGLTRDLQLDLNGYSVARVNTGKYKLICKDSATDHYDASTYGSIPAGTACQAENGYLDITQEDRVSFHKYEVAITAVNLRPGNTGIYYSCVFRGDEAVKQQVSGFGLAVSLETDLDEAGWQRLITEDTENKIHVWYEGNRWGEGGAATNGVILQNILKPEFSPAENKRRGEMSVQGVNYLQLRSGRWLFGNVRSLSLRSVMELLDNSNLEITQQALDMYRTYEAVMSQWDTDRIAAAAK